MNRLEEKIQSEINEFFGSPKGVEELGSKTFRNALIDIQKDVAVKFAEWKDKHYLLWSHLYVIKSDYQHTGWPETIELPDLFDYFITNVYGK